MRIALTLVLVACGAAETPALRQQRTDVDTAAVLANPGFAVTWMQLISESARADGLSAPETARALAYFGVAMHEITRFSATETLPSLLSQLNGLNAALPEPAADLDWNVALAQAMASLAGVFLPSDEAAQALRAKQVAERKSVGVTDASVTASIDFGARIANAIVIWAAADGFAETIGQSWTATPAESHWSGVPVQPYFGSVRPFALATSDDCRAKRPKAFSTDTDSAFYQEAKQSLNARNNATAEERASIAFWSDEATHWVAIASERLRRDDSRLARAGKTYALLGLALADGYITAWQDKYRYTLLRPVTYIQRYIDGGWTPLAQAVSAPEYVSSQALTSVAAAQVMTLLYGDDPIQDQGREFASYWDAALEAADTGVIAGTQFPMSVDAGISSGVCVARALVDRVHL